MGSVTGYTAAHMLAIENATVTSMAVNGAGHLIVTRHDGSTFDAGDVSVWLPGRLKTANNLGAGNDPNAFTQNGWYAGTNWANSLLGYTFGIIEVLAYDANYIVQNFWLASNPGRWFTRSLIAGAWTTWLEKDVPATTAIRGEVLLASDADAVTGTDATKAVTPHALTAAVTSFSSNVSAIGTIADIGLTGYRVLLQSGVTVTVVANAHPKYLYTVGESVNLTLHVATNTYTLMGPNAPANYLRAKAVYSATYRDYEGYLTGAEWNSNSALMAAWPGIDVTKTAAGIVMVTGLVSRATAGFTVNDIVATLPVGFRPEYTCFFPAYANGAWIRLQVDTDGTIRIASTNGTSGIWLSLSKICFPVGLTWTNATLLNGCTPVTAAISGVTKVGSIPAPGFAMDSNGFVWSRGIVAHPGSALADGTAMWTYPAGFGPVVGRQHHQICASYGGTNAWSEVGKGGASLNRDNQVKGGSAVTQTSGMCLDGTPFVSETAVLINNMAATTPATGQVGVFGIDGMSTYAGGNQWVPTAYRAADGFCYLSGLNAQATSGNKMGTLSPLFRTKGRLMIASDNSNTPDNVYMYPNGSTYVADGTASSWQSVDVCWMADPQRADDLAANT